MSINPMGRTTPCPDCPFRSDVHFFLAPRRIREIRQAVLVEGRTFQCHKTLGEHRDRRGRFTSIAQHCGGAMILLQKLGRPNTAMQVFERLGWCYDPAQLDLEAPVFDSFEEMIETAERMEGEAG